MKSTIDWLFRSRVTGRITIAQFPNLSLGLFLVASAVRAIFRPSGALGTAVGVAVTGALVWWALDEVIRGVNPWRRFLGGTVLLGQLVRFVVR
ncbi:MAG: hypothetical protein ACRDV9_02830 [Acidimicrobiia bacterium]